MKTTQANSLYALAGAAACLLVFGLTGMTQSLSAAPIPGGSRSLPLGPTLTIKGIPTPEQMMRVVEGNAFVVPADKLFVATGMGSTSGASHLSVTAQFDGSDVLQAVISQNPLEHAAGPAIPSVPPGLVAPAGVTVSVFDDTIDDGVLLGYLADV